MLKKGEILRRLSDSQIYRDYEKAFTEATDLPLTLRPKEVWDIALKSKKGENPFCALLAQSNKSCAACLRTQDKLTAESSASGGPNTVTCFAGLKDSVVPIRVSGEVIGFLQTGQIAHSNPTKARFSRVTKQLLEWGVSVDLSRLEDAFFHSRVIESKQYMAMVSLLTIFAEHLSTAASQILIQSSNDEPTMVVKARQYIDEHSGDEIPLNEISRVLNVSTFHFCKTFKKATGMTFTEYLARTRVEKARNLLLNPNLRISEIAYGCGFGSIGHFNRVFRRIVGTAPTDYRSGLHGGKSVKVKS